MRIALTYMDLNMVGGVERHVVECANFLARRGHEVHVLAASIDDQLLAPGIHCHVVRVRRRPDALFALGFRRNATRAMDAAGRFDVHASFSALSPLGGVFWTPSVHAEAYEAALRWRSDASRVAVAANPYHRVRLRLERQLYSPGGYRRIVAYTEAVKQEIVRHYGVPETDIDVLPLGIDTTVFSAARRSELRERARAELGYGPDERVVLFVANELERKGYDVLLRAVARLDDPAVRLHVVGAVDPSGYRTLTQQLGLQGRVSFAGSTEDVAFHHAASDVFALPTRYEPWGLVIVEALASGLPVVTSRLAGAAAAVEERRTGMLLDDPEDAAELAEHLRWALSTAPATAAETSSSVAAYAWEKILARWEKTLIAVATRTDTKPTGYYGAARVDLVAQLPAPLGRVLDVGCGAGGVGRSLRRAGASHLVGVEVNQEAAEVAREVFDHVVMSSVEDALEDGLLRGPFDTIVCYDVLEHLVDPEGTLRSLLELAAPGSRLHVSVPNARHFSLVRDLVFHGTFGYAQYGHRDTTHLRWFTRTDIIATIARAGWQVDSYGPNTFGGYDRPVDRITAGRAREFIALQWHVLAHAPA